MKKNLIAFITLFCFIFGFSKSVQAQTLSPETLLDTALSLAQKGNNNTELATALGMATMALEKELNNSTGDAKTKLLTQLSSLKGLLPMAAQGTVKKDVLSKTINTVKLLLGANRIGKLLSGGKSSLLGKTATVVSALGLVKTGVSILSKNNQSKLGKMIDGATKSANSLDKKGLCGKLAAGAATRKLGGISSLLTSLL